MLNRGKHRMFLELKITITVDENQEVYWRNWRFYFIMEIKISLGGEYKEGFSRKDVQKKCRRSHEAGGSDPGTHPNPIYQSPSRF